MKYLIATSDRHLGLCLRLLSSMGIAFMVVVEKNQKGKTFFKVVARTNKQRFAEAERLYNDIIS